MEQTNEQKQFFTAGKIIGLLIVLLIVALSTSIYFYTKYNNNGNKTSSINSQEEVEKELQNTIKMVSKHIVLPQDETPTMATVSDPEKLKDQPFFANAKKGDKVLIFSISQKAILYDPVADRIIEVAPINTSSMK